MEEDRKVQNIILASTAAMDREDKTTLIRFYRTPGLHPAQQWIIRKNFEEFVRTEGLDTTLIDLQTEYCYHIEAEKSLNARETKLLQWLLSETFEQRLFAPKSFLQVFSFSFTKERE